MKKLEKRHVENPVAKWAREHGVRNLKLGSTFSAGWPDRIFFIPGGAPLLIEFKRPGEVPTKLQQEMIKHLRSIGYAVHVVDNKEEGIALLKAALEAAPVPASIGGVPRRKRGGWTVP